MEATGIYHLNILAYLLDLNYNVSVINPLLIKSFIKSAPRGISLSILAFALSFAVVFGIGMLLGKGILLSLLMSTILSGVSSAVVLPFLKNLDAATPTKLSLMFDSAFSDVLCILGTVTIIEIFTAETAVAVTGLSVLNNILSSFLIAIALGLIAAFLWNNVLRKSLGSHRLVLTLAFMLIVYALTEILGANGAIACLVFGLILGNSKKIVEAFSDTDKIIPSKKTAKKDSKKSISKEDKQSILPPLTRHGKDVYSELAFAIKTFFFVYLGILINFSDFWSFAIAGFIVLGLYFVRPIAVFFTFGRSTKVKDARILSTLIPKGLAAAVLVQLPIQAGIAGAESLVNITLAVIFISIIVSTFLVFLIQRGKYKGFMPLLFKKYRVDPVK